MESSVESGDFKQNPSCLGFYFSWNVKKLVILNVWINL